MIVAKRERKKRKRKTAEKKHVHIKYRRYKILISNSVREATTEALLTWKFETK
jgi:hypothetical protein